MIMSQNSRTCVIAAFAVAVVATAAAAQDCVRVDTDPPQSTLTLKLSSFESKAAPVTYCSLQPGVTYRLTISSKKKFRSGSLAGRRVSQRRWHSGCFLQR